MLLKPQIKPKDYQVPVLMYHRVIEGAVNHKFNFVIRKEAFFKQMSFLYRSGYETMVFQDIAQGKHLTTDKKPIILTFDDGYEDNFKIAFPVLKQFGFKAVIYLVTGCNDNQWDLHHGLDKEPLMNRDQIKHLSDYGIEFGGHAHGHPNLKEMHAQELLDNLLVNKKQIQECTQKEVFSFAYPYGAFTEETKSVVKQVGYSYAVATKSGPAIFLQNPYEIRRIDINKKTILPIYKTKTSGIYYKKKFNFLDWITF